MWDSGYFLATPSPTTFSRDGKKWLAHEVSSLIINRQRSGSQTGWFARGAGSGGCSSAWCVSITSSPPIHPQFAQRSARIVSPSLMSSVAIEQPPHLGHDNRTASVCTFGVVYEIMGNLALRFPPHLPQDVRSPHGPYHTSRVIVEALHQDRLVDLSGQFPGYGHHPAGRRRGESGSGLRR